MKLKELKFIDWKELRPVLRESFGKDFYFYNDKYKSGKRRIKICTTEPEKMCTFINALFPFTDCKLWNDSRKGKMVTIYYNN